MLPLNVILLISLVNTLCFLLLNLRCGFNNDLRLSMLTLFFSNWFMLFLS